MTEVAEQTEVLTVDAASVEGLQVYGRHFPTGFSTVHLDMPGTMVTAFTSDGKVDFAKASAHRAVSVEVRSGHQTGICTIRVRQEGGRYFDLVVFGETTTLPVTFAF